MQAGHNLPNWKYQQGELYQEENIKMYVRVRDKYTCQYCGEKRPPRLEVDHIVPKSHGGATAPHNLVAACHDCNRRKGNVTAEEFGYPDIQAQARKSLREAAHTQQGQNVTIAELSKLAPVSVTFGYITKVDREQMKLPKTHYFDAVAIASHGDSVITFVGFEKMRAVSRGQRQLYRTSPSKGGKFQACRLPYEVFGFRMNDKVALPDGTIGFVSRRRKTGSFGVNDIDGNEIRGGITYKKLVLIERAKTLLVVGIL